jgi:hypothetical protein
MPEKRVLFPDPEIPKILKYHNVVPAIKRELSVGPSIAKKFPFGGL